MLKKTLVEFTHDVGYGENLLSHINRAIRGKDMRADRIVVPEVSEPVRKFVSEPNPWNPITEPIDLKHLGKLSEELGELQSAVSRCVIQGVDEREPSTGEVNRFWLTKEIADVLANIELVVEHLNLDEEYIEKRILAKKEHLRQWHRMS